MNLLKEQVCVRRESRVSSLYPITHLNTPSIFESKTGFLGSVLRVQGVPFVTEDATTLNQLNAQWHQALSLLDERFITYVTVHRTRQDLKLKGEFSSNFAAHVNEKYHARFKTKHLYRNDIYLTIVLKGDTSGKVAKGLNLFNRFSDAHSKMLRVARREKNRALLITAVGQLQSQLADFSPALLGEQDVSLGRSELMQFLSIIPNGGQALPFVQPAFCAPIANCVSNVEAVQALYPEGHLGQYIGSKRILFGDCIQFQGASRMDTTFGVMLSVKKYPRETASLVLDALLQLDCEFIATHTFAPIARDTALKNIESKRGRMENANDLSASQLNALGLLEDDIASERVRLGFHHNTVMLLADTQDELESSIQKATGIYSSIDMTLVRETVKLGLEPVFWAQIPGNHHLIARVAPITSLNFVDFCPLHNERCGFHDENHLMSAVTILESVSKTPVYFNYHGKSSKTDPANGHTAIYGATKSGKNTLVAFMDAQMGRYNGRSFFLDRDEASKIYVLASGNSAYTRIAPDNQAKAQMNPFQLPDTLENRTFLKSWLAELIKLPNEDDVPSDIASFLNECVNYAYDSLDASFRQLSHVVKSLPRSFPRWPELNRWLKGHNDLTDGEFAWIFDNETDALSFDFDKVGFDITYLMDEVSSLIATPVYMVLLHRMRQCLDGRLTSFVLDEAWQILSSPFWVRVLNTWLPSIRKKNGHFIFMTQSPETVVESSISSIITTNLSTTIAFPNPSATACVYQEGLGFSESEYQTIKDLNPKSRLFLYRQFGEQSIVCRLDLTQLSDEIRVFSGNKVSVALLDKILEKVGFNEQAWLPLFIERSRA